MSSEPMETSPATVAVSSSRNAATFTKTERRAEEKSFALL